MQFTSHLFEISLTGYKEPKKWLVNRISWPRGWGKIYSWLVFFFFSTSFPGIVNVCKVSAVIFRAKPSISSKYTPFKRTQEAVHSQRKMEYIMKSESEWHRFFTDTHFDKRPGINSNKPGKLREYYIKAIVPSTEIAAGLWNQQTCFSVFHTKSRKVRKIYITKRHVCSCIALMLSTFWSCKRLCVYVFKGYTIIVQYISPTKTMILKRQGQDVREMDGGLISALLPHLQSVIRCVLIYFNAI